jgi:hypothetical protein
LYELPINSSVYLQGTPKACAAVLRDLKADAKKRRC